MYIVYILQSKKFRNKLYKGYTTDLGKRLKAHNSTTSGYTSKYQPWKLVWFATFENKKSALAFEKYLKTGSGIAFMRKRLID